MFYGIENCDTIRKAKFPLIRHQLNFRFHDYRKQGLERTQLSQWVLNLRWEIPVNRLGTAWRRLPEQVQYSLIADSVLDLMPEMPAFIKRPLLENNSVQHIGFSKQYYYEIFNR